jgi:hypothetical protein
MFHVKHVRRAHPQCRSEVFGAPVHKGSHFTVTILSSIAKSAANPVGVLRHAFQGASPGFASEGVNALGREGVTTLGWPLPRDAKSRDSSTPTDETELLGGRVSSLDGGSQRNPGIGIWLPTRNLIALPRLGESTMVNPPPNSPPKVIRNLRLPDKKPGRATSSGTAQRTDPLASSPLE